MDIKHIEHIIRKTDAEWDIFISRLSNGYMSERADYEGTIKFYSLVRKEGLKAAIRAGISSDFFLIGQNLDPNKPEDNKTEENRKTKEGSTDAANNASPKNRKTSAIPEGKGTESIPPNAEHPRLKGIAKGHGRRGVRDFLESAELVEVPPDFPNDNGEKYSQYIPAYKLVLSGSMNLTAKIYVLPRRRALSGELQTTSLPKEVGPLYARLDAEAVASLVFSHYKMGATHYGISSFHGACGVPLSPSTQWDAIEKGANAVFRVHQELNQSLANADVIQIDSTGKKVMSIKKDIESRQAQASAAGKNPDSVRHGIRTTSTLGILQGQEKISIFVTGEEHAGEVLDKLLQKRTIPEDVLLACDASSQNTDTKFKDIILLCLCNAHAFRKFDECAKDYPNLVPQIVMTYQKVFANERYCVEHGIQKDERLKFHFQHSSSLMMEIYQKLSIWQEKKLFTPKSALGLAAKYFLNNFEGLCGFLQYANAPMHNNDSEIEIKVSVKHRKNSLFYQTENGANIGDIWMSLIQTAILNKLNPWTWIVDMLRHPAEVASQPKAWLPWNWKTLEATI